MKFFKGLTKKQILLLIGALPFNFLVYYAARLITKNMVHYDLSIGLDYEIPFLAWMAIFYWGCYVFWLVNYILCTRYDKGNGYKFILTHYFGDFICFLFFIILPTEMVRAENLGSGIFDLLVRFTYFCDEPNNLFPSIHCMVSWICWIGVRKNKNIPVWYQVVSFFMAAAVCVTTLTIKQHVFVDVVAGIALAEIGYVICGIIDKKLSKQKRIIR